MDTKEQGERRIREKIEGEFSELEAAMVTTNPGVLDVLKVYGDYEAAMRQADAYFAALDPEPIFSTSDSSGGCVL